VDDGTLFKCVHFNADYGTQFCPFIRNVPGRMLQVGEGCSGRIKEKERERERELAHEGGGEIRVEKHHLK